MIGAFLFAVMAELVDASDLKSGGPNGSCGFEPHLRHDTKKKLKNFV